MTTIATQKSLQFASAVVMAFGLATASATLPATNAILALFVDLVFWPFDGTQSLVSPEARLLSGVLGGITLGWGMLLWLTSSKVFPTHPVLARQMILTSTLTWFVVDSVASVIAGAALNVVPNLVFLALFWMPLWRKSATLSNQLA
jgi:hypothetical protein